MKTVIATLTLTLGFIFCAQPIYAEEKKAEPSTLWESLRQKIETLTPKKKLVATTAVGGVRGALIESDDLYWKGAKEEQVIDVKEFKEFEHALVLYESGNREGARDAFNKFIEDHPESNLATDARSALQLLQVNQQATP